MRVVMVDEHRFRAMGTDCELHVIEGDPELGDLGEAMVRADEQRWSRFEASSELSQLNRGEGTPVEVSAPTAHLLGLAAAAHRDTRGWFDPFLGRQIAAAGYDRSFEHLVPVAPEHVPGAAPTTRWMVAPTGTGDPASPLVLDERTAKLGPGVALDLGGIAKGHSADRVAESILAAGAEGVCVNLGGDLRCAGTPADGDAWWMTVDHQPSLALGLTTGGVATSTVRRRRWATPDGSTAHHLLDPHTGRPAVAALHSATVVADTAAEAEVLAKVVLLAPWDEARSVLVAAGAVALATDRDGEAHRIGDVDAHLAPLPEGLAR